MFVLLKILTPLPQLVIEVVDLEGKVLFVSLNFLFMDHCLHLVLVKLNPFLTDALLFFPPKGLRLLVLLILVVLVLLSLNLGLQLFGASHRLVVTIFNGCFPVLDKLRGQGQFSGFSFLLFGELLPAVLCFLCLQFIDLL